MALEKQTVISKVEINEGGDLSIRTTTKILEDGVVISESHHRKVIHPGQDVSGEDASIIAIATAVHTQEKIDAYNARASQ